MTGIESPPACTLLRQALEDMQAVMAALIGLQEGLDASLPRNRLAPELLQDYNRQLERLIEAEGRRTQALVQLGLDARQMDAALEACPTRELASLWAAIREQLPLLSRTNRKHALILAQASAGAQACLELLGALPSPPVYGPDGRREGPGGGRNLGRC